MLASHAKVDNPDERVAVDVFRDDEVAFDEVVVLNSCFVNVQERIGSLEPNGLT